MSYIMKSFLSSSFSAFCFGVLVPTDEQCGAEQRREAGRVRWLSGNVHVWEREGQRRTRMHGHVCCCVRTFANRIELPPN
eukprot:SAG22_NODE_2981_length_2054_cov_1.827621_2_plen_80_part_00